MDKAENIDKTEIIIAQTKKWIVDVVIGCNFCPFAARVINMDSVHYRVETSNDLKICGQSFLQECKRLDETPAIETSFLIFPETFSRFKSYLELGHFVDQLMKNHRYEGVYQVATFHPLYHFGGSALHDPANYTNRSPYPMLHLLREDLVTKALEHYPNPEKIPERNIGFARQKGEAYLKMLRDACLK